MSRKDIPSPFSQRLREDIAESFPGLDPLRSSRRESGTISSRWRYIHSYWQDEFQRQRIKDLGLGNRKLWPLLLTIFCFAVVFTKGPTRSLVLSPLHSVHLDRPSDGSMSLVDFQLSPPVRVPADADCNVTFMEYSFGNSYGAPFVGE